MIVVQERYSFLSSSTQAQKNAEREPWELPISRTVRAAGKAQPGQCCIKPKEELSDKMKSSYLNCFKETRPSMNNKFMAHIRNENQTDEVFTQKEEIITRCIDFSNQFSKERGDVDFFGKSCNMAPLAFVQCIKGFEQINCPEELKVKSSLCEMARMRIEELILIWKI
ncbi:hypothetical protein C0J52_10251 [Blattella germanica]|nr:hypothetical protein C0J52_10251 [Blattella germanica]